MTGVAALWFALALTVAVGDWLAVHAGRRTAEYVAKPLTMVLLIGAALALDPVDGAVRVAFVVALAFSLAGDIFLMLPRDLFVAGLASFLIGHLAYITGLQLRGQSGEWFVLGLVVVLAVILVVGVRIVRAVRAGDDALAVPVTAYLAVISLMVASAFGTGNGFAMAGALLFYASDAMIAWNRFVQPHPWARVAIMTTYHLGQFGLVLSLL
ncbi:lysoplasmalogenase [Rhabdothermincola sediminis]|uniref:lysoplasmalogenase n=1 Tax=Rhabdothermincola sediminis TaxID=2751370 RepID=UPI001AA0896B|nr:lysoplasmalogenase [Rhabdothermincola sediminis]